MIAYISMPIDIDWLWRNLFSIGFWKAKTRQVHITLITIIRNGHIYVYLTRSIHLLQHTLLSVDIYI